MKKRLKRVLQHCVIYTTVPPLDSFYTWVYGLLASATGRVLASFDGVSAVYVRRGVARSEIVPGMSDLDFLVIMEENRENDLLERFALECVLFCRGNPCDCPLI